MSFKAISALMQNKPESWKERGLCVGDARFTGRLEWLTAGDLDEMTEVCLSCTEFLRCATEFSGASGVFAAAEWRGEKT